MWGISFHCERVTSDGRSTNEARFRGDFDRAEWNDRRTLRDSQSAGCRRHGRGISRRRYTAEAVGGAEADRARDPQERKRPAAAVAGSGMRLSIERPPYRGDL